MSTLKVDEGELEEDLRRPDELGLLGIASPDPAAASARVALTSELEVGRAGSPGLDLALNDPSVSAQHATLRRKGTLVEVSDRGSTNGTFVDGGRVRTAVVAPGSIVRFGKTLFEVAALPPPYAVSSPDLIGRSATLHHALGELDRVAALAVSVLILGETGTGKELAARRVHEHSGRRGRFVAVNCAAIAHQLFEASLFGHKKGAFTDASRDNEGFVASADGGTLFLDEVGELPLELQPKLLRVLENQEYSPVGSTEVRKCSARIVAATNVDLGARVKANAFRRDLYARLAGYMVELPPLRRRRADVFLLACHFLRQLAPTKRVEWPEQLIESLVLYDWPMNVREVRIAMQRIALLPGEQLVLRSSQLRAALPDLDTVGNTRVTLAATAEIDNDNETSPGSRPSREELLALLAELRGNVYAVAQRYKKERRQVYRWLKLYGLDANDYR
jgi:sigma-54 dependent transcriptional regulator, acetoin dehydrogenase operon transcriptional activator AcoR